MNCMQAICYGALELVDFFFYFGVTSFGSFVISVVVSRWLQKSHRMSFVELLLLVMLMAGMINMPYGLWHRYVSSGRDTSVIFGFGSLC